LSPSLRSDFTEKENIPFALLLLLFADVLFLFFEKTDTVDTIIRSCSFLDVFPKWSIVAFTKSAEFVLFPSSLVLAFIVGLKERKLIDDSRRRII
jgi:hypothetical protein